MNEIDYSGYPDCRPQFLEAFEKMANLATKAGVNGETKIVIHAPLMKMTKAEIVRKAVELGVDVSLTHSCYDPDARGRACGKMRCMPVAAQGIRGSGRDGSRTGVKISEIFYSLQGEGMLVGMPSVFVRTSGCNLRCTWCDTPYTSWHPEGEDLAVEQIVRAAASFGASHVVVTGGEPMIAPEIADLTAKLREAKLHITIETAGTSYKRVECDLMSISPKLKNSTPARARERTVGSAARAIEISAGDFTAAYARLRLPIEVCSIAARRIWRRSRQFATPWEQNASERF